MEQLTGILDIDNIINDYKYQLEHFEKIQKLNKQFKDEIIIEHIDLLQQNILLFGQNNENVIRYFKKIYKYNPSTLRTIMIKKNKRKVKYECIEDNDIYELYIH